MANTPENLIKKHVVKLLNSYGLFHWPAAASPYGVGGVPDRLCILPKNGRLIGIEVKAPGKKPTPLQEAFGRQLQRNNAHWFVIDGGESLALLRRFLEEEL